MPLRPTYVVFDRPLIEPLLKADPAFDDFTGKKAG